MYRCGNILYHIWARLQVLFHFSLVALWGYTVLVVSFMCTQQVRRNLFYWGAKICTYSLLFLLCIRIRYKGVNAPSPPQAIYIANHTSYIDALLILLVSDARTFPIGKSEISKIPIWGYLYKQFVIPLDRQRLGSKKRSYHTMEEHLKNGGSVFIFPEGGFEDCPTQPLYPFNSGAFRLSLQYQVPLYPMLFIDTHKRFRIDKHKIHIRAGNIIIHRLTPIYPPSVTEASTKDLLQIMRTHTFNTMQSTLLTYT